MNHQQLSFNDEQLNRLFPFFIIVNKKLLIESYGKGLKKLNPSCELKNFFTCFHVEKPELITDTFDNLKSVCNQLVIVKSNNNKETILRGQFEYLNSGKLLFVGSPWFSSVEQVMESDLTVLDFAHHDPLIDILHVLKAQEINNDDLKELLNTVNSQKIALNNAADELRDIALFPHQSPDPLIRINSEGAILMHNPPAEKLTAFQYYNQFYEREEFWKLIAKAADIYSDRWTFEAKSDNRVYSFVCRFVEEKKYFNIYGRDITEQKKNEQQINLLSLAASANNDGVVFLDENMIVRWVNASFEKMTGFAEYDIIGKSSEHFFYDIEIDKDIVERTKEAEQKKQNFNIEIKHRRKNGSWFWASIDTVFIHDPEDDAKIWRLCIVEDITIKRNQQSEIQRLSLLASNNENGVVFTGMDGKITWSNDGFRKLTGYTEEEIIGKTPIELCAGNLTDKNELQKMVNLFASGETFDVDLIHYKKDGSWFWGRVNGQAVKDQKGIAGQYFAMIKDVTAEKQNEEKLKVLSKIAEENINAVIIADRKGRITWVNKSYTAITGYTLEEVEGKSPGHILQGPETDQRTVTYLRTQIKNGESFNTEILNYNKNGQKYWIRIQGQPIKNDSGELTGFFALEEDITRERESEYRFRKALENIGDNVWEHNFKTGKTYFSKSESGISGYSTNNVTNNTKLWLKCIHKDDLHLLLENHRKYKNCEIDSHNLEYRMVHHDGTVKWVLDRGVVVERDALGKPSRITGTHIDITHQKGLELELRKSREQAERLGYAKEIFLANMSHEIRTPMNAIIGMSNQMGKTKLTSQQNFYLNTINSAAENLLVIINDILDLSKIEAGKLSIEKIGFEPKKVVGNAIQVFMHKAEEKGLRLTNSYCDARVSSILIGDPFRLNQVLLNLISNAIKFTESGSIDVTCAVINDTENSQTIEAKVTDTGIGMEKEFVEKLFDKFSQEYESVTRRFGGTGLGMSICKELIELMGGEIEVQSEKRKGTSIIFRIEFKKGTLEDLPMNAVEQITGDFLKGKKILVADDNDMNRLVASTILGNYGASTLDATNGKEAIEFIEKEKPDLVLMDIQMPEMNGYDATKSIRAKGNHIPVIALTANAIKGENEKCLSAGMNDYISKPFKEDEFLKKIAFWVKAEINSTSIEDILSEADNKPLYDLTSLNAISGGNSAFLEKMINIFCLQTPGMARQMREAFKDNNLEAMGAIAHKIKPSIDNLNITTLRQIIRTIEKAGKDRNNIPELPQLLKKSEVILNYVVNLMREQQLKNIRNENTTTTV